MDNVDVTSKKVETINHVTVASSVLENLFGVTSSRIRQLTKEGIIVRASKGKYSLADSIKNYILNLKTKKELEGVINKDLDVSEERAKLYQVQTRKEELKLALMEGSMHNADEIEIVMIDMLASFKTRMRNLPVKMAPIVANKTNVAEIEKILNKEVLEICNELKDYNPKDFVNKDYIDFEDEVEETYD